MAVGSARPPDLARPFGEGLSKVGSSRPKPFDTLPYGGGAHRHGYDNVRPQHSSRLDSSAVFCLLDGAKEPAAYNGRDVGCWVHRWSCVRRKAVGEALWGAAVQVCHAARLGFILLASFLPSCTAVAHLVVALLTRLHRASRTLEHQRVPPTLARTWVGNPSRQASYAPPRGAAPGEPRAKSPSGLVAT